MRLYDTISQVDLNSVIDKLLNNYHREIGLDLDEPSNDYCSLEFDLSDGVDAGSEVIFNDGDELGIGFGNPRLAELGYGIRFYYYLLDKGDYTQSKSYGELQSFTVDLDDDTVTVPFTDNQVYLQKGFDLVLMNTGESLLLSVDKSILFVGEDLTLTAFYSLDTLPVEDASVSFYNGETLLDTVVTDEDGEASLTLSDLSVGSYSFSCVCEGKYSESIFVNVVTENIMVLGVTGDSFSTYSSTPFTYNGRVFVDWGDDSGIVEYTGGKLTHTYSSSDDYTVKIYGDITSLGSSCFRACIGLTSIVVPNSVTSLESNCFYGCTGLTSINIPSSVTSLEESCFYGCTGLTSITIPNSVTSLGQYCFYYCTGLTSITLPDSVTNLERNCFESCTGLTSIIIPNGVTVLPGYCFTNCTGLTSIIIPNSVTSLGAGCFKGCTSLTSISIPSSVTIIRTLCFNECTSLTSILLNWSTNDEILTYSQYWITYTYMPSNLKFHIPQGTTSLYTAKSYPSTNLVEDNI